MHGWIGVDLDGTLMIWRGNGDVMGDPVPVMVQRVKNWVRQGKDVRIFTSRASIKDEEKRKANISAVEQWCLTHVGVVLPVTCVKDFNCAQYWDDKAVRVIKNTGLTEEEFRRERMRGRKRRIER